MSIRALNRAAEHLLKGERAARVRRRSRELPRKQRATLILRMYHEMSHQEIADIARQLGRRGQGEFLSRAGQSQEAARRRGSVMRHLTSGRTGRSGRRQRPGVERTRSAPAVVRGVPAEAGGVAGDAVGRSRGRRPGTVAAVLGSFLRARSRSGCGEADARNGGSVRWSCAAERAVVGRQPGSRRAGRRRDAARRSRAGLARLHGGCDDVQSPSVADDRSVPRRRSVARRSLADLVADWIGTRPSKPGSRRMRCRRRCGRRSSATTSGASCSVC